MGARTKNKALVYVRRSKSKQETGIRTQLQWAIDAAKEHGLQLDATPEDLEYMVAKGLGQYKAIFVDDGISGSDLNRPGFAAFRETALDDRSVSHLLIHLSDRFARPELAIQAMQMEVDLLLAGITVVFSNRTSLPRQRGQHYFAEDIQLLHEYTQNGEFLTKLATRVLQTQIRLAEGGYWTGGPAPYGFVRVLVDASGNEVMELEQGMTVSQSGCHVRIKPKDMEQIRVWLQILDLHGNHKWGHKRIANHLNRLGIPSPHAGRVYERDGIPTEVSGRWWPETVKRMIQNRAIVGACAYGKTSVGVHRRFSPDGPRNLDDDNDRRDDGEAKFTLNPDSQVIVRPTGFNPQANLELFEKCRELTEERGRSQRGIPRAVNLDRYPLSTLIRDITDECGAVMFGHKAEHKLEYECSRYRQSGGQECQRHVVDAEASLRFVLRFLRQRIEMGGGREAIRARVRQVANAEQVQRPHILEEELQLAEQRLGRLETELDTIGCNAARAGNAKLLRTIERQYEQKDAEVEAAREEVERLRGEVEEGGGNASLEGQIDAAMTLFDRIDRLTQEPEARSEIGEMLRDLDFRMWLRFHANPRGKRPKRVLQGGLITIGQGELPLLANHHGSDHPPDADDGGDDLASPSARNGLPTVVGKPRQREGTSFGKVTGGKPPVAPDSQFTS